MEIGEDIRMTNGIGEDIRLTNGIGEVIWVTNGMRYFMMAKEGDSCLVRWNILSNM